MFLGDIYHSLVKAKHKGSKSFAVLLDPDSINLTNLEKILSLSVEAKVDYFLIGGSLVVNDSLDFCLKLIKQNSTIPTVLFPGNSYQLSQHADAILFLSLISGRNAELLIGNHVLAAPFLKKSTLEVIPTGYMLIDGGVSTTVEYISNTKPIPAHKSDIALCTALAGEMLGLKLLYLDAGSGAIQSVPPQMISLIQLNSSLPIIVGGGIKSVKTAKDILNAGADLIVVGNAIEKNPNLLIEMADAVHNLSAKTNAL